MDIKVSSMKIAILYSIFALISTAVNISAQDIFVRYYRGGFDLFISVGIGTIAGLIVKYLLDKHYIFRFQTKSLSQDSQTFALYTLMGLFTTFIFWGFEFGFDHFFRTKELRYLGGVIGLTIGYMTKYQLDKRYVFRTEKL
jgi:putative flippase GtrA